ncbi:MAG: methyltransferase domain-containing protein [Bacteroidales bacterium]|nr:methyltransferase domain-containing protein [Bacteroidales bacterium]
MKAEDLKLVVQEKYKEIATQTKVQNQNSCCGGTSCCDNMDYSIFSEDYTKLEGYNQDADLGLGCGLPTEFAGIEKGNYVLDLGSGAGNDCFVALTLVGEEGKVTGIDFTDAMIEKANKNLEKTGFKNIEIKKEKEIEIPNNSLLNYITLDELRELKKEKIGIFSITVIAFK